MCFVLGVFGVVLGVSWWVWMWVLLGVCMCNSFQFFSLSRHHHHQQQRQHTNTKTHHVDERGSFQFRSVASPPPPATTTTTTKPNKTVASPPSPAAAATTTKPNTTSTTTHLVDEAGVLGRHVGGGLDLCVCVVRDMDGWMDVECDDSSDGRVDYFGICEPHQNETHTHIYT